MKINNYFSDGGILSLLKKKSSAKVSIAILAKTYRIVL